MVERRKPANRARFIRPKALSVRWGCHRTSLWRWVRDPDHPLPEPTRLGKKHVAWPLDTIEEIEAAGLTV